MLRLFTFGGLGLEQDDGSPPELRRPHLAMLAVLAAAGDRGVSRERVASLFWPESDEEHARHSVRQLLYALRQGLGADVVRSSGPNLVLDASTITSDINDFRTALSNGERARAVAIVRGPFLDAFYLPGAAAFERWVEGERGRLTSALSAALLALAVDADRVADHNGAVEWWRQLTLLEPLSGRYAVGFLRALAVRGDRAEALAFARQHEQVIRRELEADPDPDVRRLQAELRAMPSPDVVLVQGAPAPSETASHVTTVAPEPAFVVERPRRLSHRTVLLATAVMLLFSVTAAFAWQRGWLGAAPTGPMFAVGLIREEGQDSLQAGRVLTDMVATNLARVDGLRVLANSRVLELMRPGSDAAAGYSEAARRAGATELLEGQVLDEPKGFALEIRHVELRTGIVRRVYRVWAENRFALVDSLTGTLAEELRLPPPAGSVAEATTTSLLAYRLYEEGLRAFYARDHKSAQRLMRAALVEDSTFAMAAWYEAQLVNLFGSALDGRSGLEVRQTAKRLARRAPERERLTITAYTLWADGEPGAVAVAESLTTRYPDDPRAHIALSLIRATTGDWPRSVNAAERAIALDSAAGYSGDSVCRACEYLTQLADVYAWSDSLPATQRTVHRLLEARPDDSWAFHLLVMSAARMGDTASARAWNRRLMAVKGIDHLVELRLDLFAEAYDRVETAVLPLLASSAPPDRSEGFWLYFMALRNQGRLREAMALARDGWFPGLPPLLVRHQPSAVHQAVVAFDMGDGRAAAGLYRASPTLPEQQFSPGLVARDRAWLGTRIAMSLMTAGDEGAVRALADSVENWGRGSLYGRDRRLHHYLRGLLEARAGRHEDAVRLFRSALFAPSQGFTRVNYEMGRSLLALGRPQEAIEILQAALRGTMDASNLYLSRTEVHELLAESYDRAGRRDSAAAHYRAVVSAWRRSDPSFLERRDRAASWLARNSAAIASSTAKRD